VPPKNKKTCWARRTRNRKNF